MSAGSPVTRIVIRRWLLPMAVAAVLALAPWWAPGYLIGILVIANAFAVLAMSWDLLYGYANQVNFGASFMVGLGAYTAALLSQRAGAPVWADILAGGLVALAGGFVLAIPALRLEGPHLGLVTVAAVLIMMRLVMVFTPVTGGELGMVVDRPVSFNAATTYFHSLGLMAVAFLLLVVITRSRVGLILRGLGESQEVLAASGFDPVRFKILAFGCSAFLSGLSGASLAHYLMAISPGSVLELPVTVDIVIATILGGMGTIVGPAVGAFFLVLVREYLRPLGEWRTLIVMVLALAVLLFKPTGLLGGRPELVDSAGTPER